MVHQAQRFEHLWNGGGNEVCVDVNIRPLPPQLFRIRARHFHTNEVMYLCVDGNGYVVGGKTPGPVLELELWVTGGQSYYWIRNANDKSKYMGYNSNLHIDIRTSDVATVFFSFGRTARSVVIFFSWHRDSGGFLQYNKARNLFELAHAFNDWLIELEFVGPSD